MAVDDSLLIAMAVASWALLCMIFVNQKDSTMRATHAINRLWESINKIKNTVEGKKPSTGDGLVGRPGMIIYTKASALLEKCTEAFRLTEETARKAAESEQRLEEKIRILAVQIRSYERQMNELGTLIRVLVIPFMVETAQHLSSSQLDAEINEKAPTTETPVPATEAPAPATGASAAAA